MKRCNPFLSGTMLVLLLFLLLVPGKGEAQVNINVQLHDSSEKGMGMVEISGDYFLYSQITARLNADNFLRKLDANGNMVFNKKYLNGVSHVKVFKSLDNHLVISGRRQLNCSFSPDTSQLRHFIAKLDTGGNQVFYTELNLYPDNDWDLFGPVFQYSDSSYIMISQDKFVRLSPQGQVLLKTGLGFGRVSSAIEIANQKILLSCVNSNSTNVYNLYETNLNGLSTWIKPIPSELNQFRHYGNSGAIMALNASGNLTKLSASYDILTSSSFPLLNLNNFFVQNDTVYYLRQLAAGPSSFTTYYGACDTNFVNIAVANCSIAGLNPSELLVNNSKTCLLSNYTSPQATVRSMVMLAFDKLTCPQLNNWIRVSEPVTDSAYIQYPPQGNPVLVIRIKFKVKNVGNQVIQSFYMSHSNLYNCGEGSFYTQQYSGLNLLPGDSIWISSPFFNKPITGQSEDGVLSFYISKVNGSYDLPSDNMFSHAGLNFLTIPEGHTNTDQFNIYPNPFTASFHMQSEPEIKGITVVNALGKVVCKRVCKDKEVVLDLQELEPGVYLVRIETERGAVAKKVIKE